MLTDAHVRHGTGNRRSSLQKSLLRAGLTGLALAACAACVPRALVAPPAAEAPPAPPVLGFSVANMDRSVDPRQDFTLYATGNWLRQTAIPESEDEAGGFTQLAANLDQQLLVLIKDAAAGRYPDRTPRQQIGDYYRAAMNDARLNELRLQPLEADLKRLDALTGPAELGRFSARLEMGYGASPLVNAFATPDSKNSSTTLLVIHPGLQALERDEYIQADGQRVRDLYRDFIIKMFLATGDLPDAATANARTVLAIETELAGARLTMLQQRDPSVTYNKLTLAEVQALIPAVDLTAFLDALEVVPPATVQVMDVNGLKAVQKVLAGRSPAELRTLLRWHIISARASVLGQPWRGLDQEFTRLRKGLQVSPSREREVTRAISTQLFHPLSQLYVQAYFPAATKAEITRMVAHIKAEFEARLRSNSWLDGPTRTAALEKLAKIDIQVGYPQQWIDFSAVEITPDDHFGNVQRAAAFILRRELAQVGKPVLQDRFAGPNITTPIAVNAAYNPQYNSIDITAAIVQPPFYKQGADAAVNYCTIGAVIGHELTHGFDSMGRQYGPAGNLRDWWTPQATAEFKKRTDLLVEQYGEYTILPGLKHNGELTLTENTADLGGITLAYAALQRELAGNPQPVIDGLSTDQRCFVAWAQMWAYKARPERLRLLATIDYHANSTLRGFVPLLHLDSFYTAFAIRPGDPLWRAPEKRVTIW